MEGLTKGWVKSRVSGDYHYHGTTFDANTEKKKSICGKHTVHRNELFDDSHLELFEIIVQDKVCPECRRLVEMKTKLQRRIPNNDFN